jgi:hypothetical protein
MEGGIYFTEPLLNNGRRDTQAHRLMGGMFEVRRRDELRCHDIHTKVHKDSLVQAFKS